MLALRMLLIRASNSAVDYRAYLNQLAALSRRDIAFSVTAQKQKVSRTTRRSSSAYHPMVCYAARDDYTKGILTGMYFIIITTRVSNLTEETHKVQCPRRYFPS